MTGKTLSPQDLEVVIGLEVHLQFNTLTKIFCGCRTTFGLEPNLATCPVCLGLPGSLPVLNRKALEYAIKVALALNCDVNTFIKFDRKNYYYPDLPKGYQISQYDFPIGRNGTLPIVLAEGKKIVRIHRAHLEEDAGKLIHDALERCSLVDYNRAGTPLMEIVTEPDLRSADEAYRYLTLLKLTLQYLGVSDCDMEKGSLRCDANISVRPKGETRLGTKSEIKNLNSFKAVKTALEFEILRHSHLFLSGEPIVQDTRLWDEAKGITILMRTKEEAHDYRYFPEPDLVPFIVTEQEIQAIRASLPEAPTAKKLRLMAEFDLGDYDAEILIQDAALADFFEQCARIYPQHKKICNWINGPVLQELNARNVGLRNLKITPKDLTLIIQYVDEETISNLVGKDLVKDVIATGDSPEDIVTRKGLAQVSDDASLEAFLDEVFKENPQAVVEFRAGKAPALGFLIGQTMKKTGGKANPKRLGDIIKRRLSHG